MVICTRNCTKSSSTLNYKRVCIDTSSALKMTSCACGDGWRHSMLHVRLFELGGGGASFVFVLFTSILSGWLCVYFITWFLKNENTTWQGAMCSVSFGWSNQEEMGRACSTHEGEERVIQGFGGKTWEIRRPLGRPGVDGRIILKWILVKGNGRPWTGSIWLRTGTGGGLLWLR
jgi:hypothetical protein